MNIQKPPYVVVQAGPFPSAEGIVIESGKVVVGCMGTHDTDFIVEMAPLHEDTWLAVTFYPPVNDLRQRKAQRRKRHTIHYSCHTPFRIRLNVTDYRNDFLVWIEPEKK